MRNSILFVLMAFFCQLTFAQTPAKEPTRYTAYGYHKVLPGKGDEFLKLAKVWKKIVAHKKKMGLQEDWSFSRVISPTGASSEYGYVTRHSFLGEDQLANYLEKPFLPENWQSLLTVDEIELQLRSNEIRTYVKGEIWYGIDQTLAEDISKSKVAVFNYFKVADGKTRADHIKAETDYWKPVHAARVKDGSLKGWLLMGLEMPFGSDQPYDLATVDVYADMKAYLAPWTDVYFKKVHPGKDADAMMKQTREASKLVKGDVRIILDRLGWE
jgi:hypothetical protein